MATQTATALARAMADTINMRMSGGTQAVAAFDSNGDAIVTLTLTAGGNHSVQAIARVKPFALPSTQVDALGLAQRVVRPHVSQVSFDSNAAGTTIANKTIILAEMFRWGTKVEWYESDPGASNIVIGSITGANLKASWEPLPGRDLDAI